MSTETARDKIVDAALAAGWMTARGYLQEAGKSAAWAGNGPDGHGVNVEFSAAGGIKYAAIGVGREFRRLIPTNDSPRLALVLAYIWNHRAITDEERDAEAERGYEQHYRPGVSDPSETSGPNSRGA